jgi:hypothetical protein
MLAALSIPASTSSSAPSWCVWSFAASTPLLWFLCGRSVLAALLCSPSDDSIVACEKPLWSLVFAGFWPLASLCPCGRIDVNGCREQKLKRLSALSANGRECPYDTIAVMLIERKRERRGEKELACISLSLRLSALLLYSPSFSRVNIHPLRPIVFTLLRGSALLCGFPPPTIDGHLERG